MPNLNGPSHSSARWATTWAQLAQKASQPGFVAYANQHAAMYTDLANNADVCCKQIGHPDSSSYRTAGS